MDHQFGRLEPGHAVRREPVTAFFHVESAVSHYEGGDPLPQPLVGTPHHHGLANTRVQLEEPLHLG